MATVSNEDLPALYRAADAASMRAQKAYLKLVRADLALIVGASLATSVALSSPGSRVAAALAGALALVAGLILTTLVLQSKPDKLWFGYRAIAESVKTIAWRYMTGAEPYAVSLAPSDADSLFANELGDIVRERKAVGVHLGGSDASGQQITAKMQQVRSGALDSRKRIYDEDRIQGQRRWYGAKARANARSSSAWLYVVAGTQLAGAAAAISLVHWPEFEVNLAAVFASAAAAFIAWLQLKQHQELAHGYGLAAHELGLIEARLDHIGSEEEFAAFVADAESAISREHTMWTARRDVVP